MITVVSAQSQMRSHKESFNKFNKEHRRSKGEKKKKGQEAQMSNINKTKHRTEKNSGFKYTRRVINRTETGV